MPEIRVLPDLLARNRSAYGDWTCLVDPLDRARIADGPARRLTWAQFGAHVDRVALALARAGLHRGDVVVLAAPTLSETLVAQMACLELGLIIAPVAAQYREGEIGAIIDRLSPRALIGFTRLGKHANAAMLATLVQARGQGGALAPAVFAFGDALPEGVQNLSDDAALTPDEQAELDVARAAAALTPEDTAFIIFTSGTSARPKAVPRSHRATLHVRSFLEDVADLPMGGCFLSPRLLNTIGSLANGLPAWLHSAARMVLHHPFDLDVFLRQIVEERPEVTSCPPAMLNMILQRIEEGEVVDLGGLHHITSGSAQIRPELFHEFRERFGISLVNVYGSSEGAMLIASDRDIPSEVDRGHCFPRHAEGCPGSRLRTVAGTQTRIVDPGSEVEITQPGKIGELRLKGVGILKGYWDDPAVTKESFDAEGWFKTGDLFTISGDAGQYLSFAGRLKNIIVRGGLNISAEEVQGLALSHPLVAEAVAVAVPDAKLGEKVGLAVVLRNGEGLSLPDLCAHLRDHCKVAVFKLPEHFQILDALPVMPSGKTDLQAIRARFPGNAPHAKD
ncbi:class I adenylate-forming enzyme family protein [Pararhodobacter oceanensis]|uniref:class I adenylate-forming enzyme family protein n=1 Tax=Pararhodobacter oceanensis TaxID=2172121 RepID=UPI003A8F16A3